MYGTNVRIIRMIVGAIIIMFSLYVMGKTRGMYYYGGDAFSYISWILFIIGVILIILSIKKTFQLSLYARSCQPSPISIGAGAESIIGNSAIISIVGSPDIDTNKMLSELGALIYDLQTMGDLAIDKWK